MPELSESEAWRMDILRQYAVLDTGPDPDLDDLTQLAAHLCATPLAYISLIDGDRQWFKSKVGLPESETPRSASFCTHALEAPGLLVVPDARQDPRFAGSSLVEGNPRICFYAGAPLITPEGAALGTLCVVDQVPRQLSADQEKAMLTLSRQVMTHLNLRRQGRALETAAARMKRLNQLYAVSSGVNEAIIRSRNSTQLYETACRIAVEIGGLSMAWVGAVPPGGRSLKPVAQWGPADAFLTARGSTLRPEPAPDDPAMAAYATGAPVIRNRLTADAGEGAGAGASRHDAAASRQGFQAAAAYPILTNGAARAVLAVYSTEEDFFDARQTRLLSAVAENLSFGVELHALEKKRLETQEALQASEQLFRDIAEVSPDAIFLNRDSKIDYINAAGLRLLHALDASEILGRDPLTLFAPEYHAMVKGRIARLLSKPCSVPLTEEKMIAVDGAVKQVEVAAVSYLSNGRLCIQVVCRDIAARKRAAAESRRTHELLQAVADGTTDAVFVKDNAGRYLLINEAAGRVVGRPAREVMGRHDAELFDARDALLIRQNDLKVIEKGESLTTEETLTGTGVSRTYQSTKTPYRDSDGKILGLIGISRDITAAKEAEALIHASRERLRMVTENAKVGLVMVTPERRYSYFNAAYLEMLDIPRRDITGLPVKEVLAPVYETQIRPRLDEAFEGKSIDYELRRNTAEGEKCYSVRYEPTRDVQGKTSLVVVVITEITDRKNAETARLASEARYRRLFEYAPDGILIADGGSHYLDANASACAMLGYTREELIGLNARDIAVPREFDHIDPALKDIKTRVNYQREWRLRRKDGSEFAAEVMATLMPDGNILAMLRDITSRKDAERAVREAGVFAQSTIDALSAQVCVLDGTGGLLATNVAWKNFTLAHDGGLPASPEPNYLSVCDAAAGAEEEDARRFAAGIRQVIAGTLTEFSMEYACHSPTEKQWFAGRVTRFPGDGPVRVVVAHENITERKSAEEALRANAAILLEAQSLAQLGHWEWDLARDEHNWSHEIYRIYGRDPRLGAATVPEVSRYFTPESWAALQAAVDRALTDATPYECDAEVVRPDGTRRWITARGTAVRDAQGTITGMHGTVQDITERRQSQEALHSSRELLTKVINSTPSYIFATDTAHRYIFVNDAFAAFMGRPPDKLLGLTARDLFPPEKGETFIAANSAIMASGEPVHTDETVLGAVLMTVKFPLRDAHGKVTGVCGVSTDITNRKLAEGRMRRLMESNIQGVFFWNHDGRITEANDAFLRMMGYNRDDLAAGALNWQEMTPPEFAPADLQALREIEKNKVCEPYEKELVRRDGLHVPVLLGAASFEDNPHEGVCFALDLTERRKLEQQFLRAQRMESIGTLAGGIAHDLNNALTPILMSLDLLKRRFHDIESLDLINLIGSSARRGADMVGQVLSFARGMEGKRVPVPMGPMLREIEKMANETFLKHISVRTAIPDDAWDILGDPTQIHQVLLNLAVNARDAMPDGGVLSLGAENVVLDSHYTGLQYEAKPGPYLIIRVGDTGIGMTPEVMERIFDPFFTTKALGHGTGLGLSTTISIIRGHGGFVRVESAVGRGTVFHLHLPALTENSDTPAEPALTEIPDGNGELILVIDDETSVLEITSRTLQSHGYQVLRAADGAEGIALFASRQREIALVLTDMMMPVMDGPAAIAIIRRIAPGMPIIAASGLADQDRIARAAALGIRSFLTKPYTAEALLQLLATVLRPGALG